MSPVDLETFKAPLNTDHSIIFLGEMQINRKLIIGWEPGGSRTGTLGSGSRVGANKVGYQESGNTSGFV